MKESYDWDYAGLAKLSGVSFTEAVKIFTTFFDGDRFVHISKVENP
jgi:hypothetical protein